MTDELAQLAEREARLEREGGWKGMRSPIIAGAILARGIVADYGIKYPGQKLPVSRMLPLDTRPGTIVNRNGHMVREHADGTTSDMAGRRIVATKRDAEMHSAMTGIRRD
jgi:hypothetical protein